MTAMSFAKTFEEKMRSKQATIGIIGLGYVGLPLAEAFCAQEINVLGFDIDATKIELLAANKSYIKHIPDAIIAMQIFFMLPTISLSYLKLTQ